MVVLGINAYHGDASACLIRDGKLLYAIAEERLNREKHCAGFPVEAIRFCLDRAGITINEVDHIATGRNPNANLHRKVLRVLRQFPGISVLKDRLAYASKIRNLRDDILHHFPEAEGQLKAQLHHVEHHRAHLASAFFVSPFEEAACLSVDGFGDFVSTMLGAGSGTDLRVLEKVEYPHSLGIYYTAVSQYIGFPKYGDEGKVMGLAPYGEPRYLEQFRDIVRLIPNGLFELNLDYFTHHTHGVDMTWESGSPTMGRIYSDKFNETFGPARKPEEPLTQHHHDLAASLQVRLEEALAHLCRRLHQLVPNRNLAYAGGVALNCTFNGMIRKETPFEEVYIQPAAGDDGTAIGSAFYALHMDAKQPRSFVMRHAYTGGEWSPAELEAALKSRNLEYEVLSTEEMAERAAGLIAGGAVLGWYQGGMEFGPRALGHRSIVVDPRRGDMKDILNARIKHREPFRPFAPSVLAERVGDFFEQDYPSPFMLMAYKVKEEKQSVIPAVTHVDGTGRLQTVEREVSPIYWGLIKAFERQTGVPVVLNTSFNENEPIVFRPEEAINCFLKTRMDALALGNFLVVRNEG
ncbi:MAG: carbamoyltransferase [Armatimonadetes bacterium]|nr:carbamoyltransferase [Armatimonadota bacterium]